MEDGSDANVTAITLPEGETDSLWAVGVSWPEQQSNDPDCGSAWSTLVYLHGKICAKSTCSCKVLPCNSVKSMVSNVFMVVQFLRTSRH